jgi:hypothetical protein
MWSGSLQAVTGSETKSIGQKTISLLTCDCSLFKKKSGLRRRIVPLQHSYHYFWFKCFGNCSDMAVTVLKGRLLTNYPSVFGPWSENHPTIRDTGCHRPRHCFGWPLLLQLETVNSNLSNRWMWTPDGSRRNEFLIHAEFVAVLDYYLSVIQKVKSSDAELFRTSDHTMSIVLSSTKASTERRGTVQIWGPTAALACSSSKLI